MTSVGFRWESLVLALLLATDGSQGVVYSIFLWLSLTHVTILPVDGNSAALATDHEQWQSPAVALQAKNFKNNKESYNKVGIFSINLLHNNVIFANNFLKIISSSANLFYKDKILF